MIKCDMPDCKNKATERHSMWNGSEGEYIEVWFCHSCHMILHNLIDDKENKITIDDIQNLVDEILENKKPETVVFT